ARWGCCRRCPGRRPPTTTSGARARPPSRPSTGTWRATACPCTRMTRPGRTCGGCGPSTSPTCGPPSPCCWSRPSSATTPPPCPWTPRSGHAEGPGGRPPGPQRPPGLSRSGLQRLDQLLLAVLGQVGLDDRGVVGLDGVDHPVDGGRPGEQEHRRLPLLELAADLPDGVVVDADVGQLAGQGAGA